MNISKVILIAAAAIMLAGTLQASPRTVYTINESWQFSREASGLQDDTGWTIVDIPHTWNAEDAQDDEPGMYRGSAWYRKNLTIPEEFEGRRAIIYFEGANQETTLYVNGEAAGNHIGGYTRFCFDITPYLNFGAQNTIAVNVTNRHNPDIPPLSADFTFFGGIYRDVYLKFINPVHIATSDHASSGIYIRTPQVNAGMASANVTALLSNDSGAPANVVVEYDLRNASGAAVASVSENVKIPAGGTVTAVSKDITVEAPHLWDVDDPYLYRMHVRVLDRRTGDLLDEISESVGFRWFSFDPEKGFFLNGKHRKLVGTARHQDFENIGNALRDEYHVQDVMLLKKMGGNFLRVSHYPQDPVVMDMCDRLGIVTSVEIPVINAVTESEEFLENSVNMAVEMVRQDFNRPSVMIWGYMNEILLRQPYEDGDTVDLPRYYEFTRKVAQALEDKIREEDPSRYTMMAYHNAPSRYENAHLTEIPMIMGWNLYQGWYEPDINEFQRLLDRAHDVYEGKVLIVTEYGPGVDVRLHSYSPEQFDFSQEYGLIYHSHYMKEMASRPFIAGSSLWNLNDFYSEPRIDTNPHVNNKGITGLDREKKDVYLYYSAVLSDEPYLKIGNREWMVRGGMTDAESGVCLQSVPVFTNASEVELSLNGESLGSRQVSGGYVHFDVPFTDGKNVLEAVAQFGEDDGTALLHGVIAGTAVAGNAGPGSEKVLKDMLEVDFQGVPECPGEDFLQMNVMLGSPRYFEDRLSGTAWIPEKEYEPGSWGYIGGEPYRRPTGFGTMLGSDMDIFGTDQDPLFQTQRQGIESFRADVPDGKYSVYLYLAELDADAGREALAYNLGADIAVAGKDGDDGVRSDMMPERGLQNQEMTRSFDVSVNGEPVLKDFNIARECGAFRAVIKKFEVEVEGGEGISVDFGRRHGEPVLNAIRIYRN